MGTELARGQNDQLVKKFRGMAEQATGVHREGAEKRGSFLGLFSSNR
jgi:hypothetical protein